MFITWNREKYGSNSHVFLFFDHIYFSIKYVIFHTNL